MWCRSDFSWFQVSREGIWPRTPCRIASSCWAEVTSQPIDGCFLDQGLVLVQKAVVLWSKAWKSVYENERANLSEEMFWVGGYSGYRSGKMTVLWVLICSMKRMVPRDMKDFAQSYARFGIRTRPPDLPVQYSCHVVIQFLLYFKKIWWKKHSGSSRNLNGPLEVVIIEGLEQRIFKLLLFGARFNAKKISSISWTKQLLCGQRQVFFIRKGCMTGLSLGFRHLFRPHLNFLPASWSSRGLSFISPSLVPDTEDAEVKLSSLPFAAELLGALTTKGIWGWLASRILINNPAPSF